MTGHPTNKLIKVVKANLAPTPFLFLTMPQLVEAQTGALHLAALCLKRAIVEGDAETRYQTI